MENQTKQKVVNPVELVSAETRSFRREAVIDGLVKTRDISRSEAFDKIYVRQGDLYISCMRELPDGAVEVKKSSAALQLVEGTTQGSRHCIAEKDAKNVTIYKRSNPNALQGPILVTTGEVELTHPEHGHVILHDPGIYDITYQKAYAEELRRVQD